MNKISKVRIIIFIICLNLNCGIHGKELSKPIICDKIKVYFIDFNLETCADIPCDESKYRTGFKQVVDYISKVIKNKSDIGILIKKLMKLTQSKADPPDTRMSIEFWQKKKLLNKLCIGLDSMTLNGESVKYDCDLLSYILKLCEYEKYFGKIARFGYLCK